MDENAAQHGSGDRDLLAAEQHGQLIFAPAGKLQTQSQNLFSPPDEAVPVSSSEFANSTVPGGKAYLRTSITTSLRSSSWIER
jgi:hypothetical protein